MKVGKPEDPEAAKAGTRLGRGANFRSVMSGTPISGEYIKAEGKAGRMGARLMAIVAEGERGRVYLSPTPEHEEAVRQARPGWKPEGLMPDNARWFSPPLKTWSAPSPKTAGPSSSRVMGLRRNKPYPGGMGTLEFFTLKPRIVKSTPKRMA